MVGELDGVTDQIIQYLNESKRVLHREQRRDVIDIKKQFQPFLFGLSTQQLRDLAQNMTNRQWVIRHKTLREHLLIVHAGFFGIGKTVGKVAANQPFRAP